MPNRSRKPRLPDPNVTAFNVIQAIAGEPQPAPEPDGKDPAAVALGRKGGLKGGKAWIHGKANSQAAGGEEKHLNKS